jgi:hypothetical protein
MQDEIYFYHRDHRESQNRFFAVNTEAAFAWITSVFSVSSVANLNFMALS